ncbi:MAG: hypothetical protein H8E42_01490 [Nitrospinae bacterium]|nr:hypothetical protein [Nitrospinota bacterium]MBL7021689.1 hypothetical protein [Nitrospinaceae bacterium]
MEVQIIQASPQLRFVGNTGRCEDCEEEQRLEDTLKKVLEEDRVSLSGASLSHASTVFEAKELADEEESATQQTGPKSDLELSEEERRLLTELRSRDAEVRAHERAHLSAAGPYANGAPTFEFQTGPDGRQYAVGGEVSIDSSPVSGDPEATVRKAQTIKRAALAPRDPSAQDRQVAAQAAQLEAQARQEVKAEKVEEKEQTTESTSSSPEENKESTTKSESSNDSSQDNPFPRRVENRFNPSSITTGNLLNIIS